MLVLPQPVDLAFQDINLTLESCFVCHLATLIQNGKKTPNSPFTGSVGIRVAERVGFEPTEPVLGAHTISSRARSTKLRHLSNAYL